MIPNLTVIIACYVITRMTQVIINKESTGVEAIFAGITILVTLIATLSTLAGGAKPSPF